MKKILVTGGCGFIGTHYINNLLESTDSQIHVLDNFSPQIHGDMFMFPTFLNDPRVTLFRGSINDRGLVKASLEGVDVVIHLAAETGTGQSMYEISKYNEVNSQGTAILLEEILNSKTNVERVVLASSRSVYGEGLYSCKNCRTFSNPLPRTYADLSSSFWDYKCSDCQSNLIFQATNEETKCMPASIYAVTKKNQEDLVVTFCAANNLDYSILRFQNVYGEGQSLKNPYTGILSIFSNRLRVNAEIPIFEDGNETRDFVHVVDVVQALSLSTFHSSPISKILNVGSGVATPIKKVAELLRAELNSSSQIRITGQFRVGDIRHNYADLSLIKNVLGYSPSVSIVDGLRSFVLWVLSQDIEIDKLDKVNEELRSRKLMR
jgi:dTDP-L-rhamnose 4-epimerase